MQLSFPKHTQDHTLPQRNVKFAVAPNYNIVWPGWLVIVISVHIMQIVYDNFKKLDTYNPVFTDCQIQMQAEKVKGKNKK